MGQRGLDDMSENNWPYSWLERKSDNTNIAFQFNLKGGVFIYSVNIFLVYHKEILNTFKRCNALLDLLYKVKIVFPFASDYTYYSYFTGTASTATTPQQVSKEASKKVTEKPYTELSVTVPSEVTKSLETSRKPVLVNIKGENGKPVLADEEANKAPMVETIVVKLPANIKAEDENAAQIKIKGPAKGHINATMSHGTTILEIPEGNKKEGCSVLISFWDKVRFVSTICDKFFVASGLVWFDIPALRVAGMPW